MARRNNALAQNWFKWKIMGGVYMDVRKVETHMAAKKKRAQRIH